MADCESLPRQYFVWSCWYNEQGQPHNEHGTYTLPLGFRSIEEEIEAGVKSVDPNTGLAAVAKIHQAMCQDHAAGEVAMIALYRVAEPFYRIQMIGGEYSVACGGRLVLICHFDRDGDPIHVPNPG